MDPKKLKELLDQHAKNLIQEQANQNNQPEIMADTDDKELASLLDVAAKIKTTLKPIIPSDNFETALKQKLLTTAQIRQAKGYIPPNPAHDLLIVTAIVGFIASLSATLILLLLLRGTWSSK